MVARKTNKNKGKKPVRTQLLKRRVPTAVAVAPVEKAVRDYIALLKDPCNGPLVGPVGATANGYITRFETTVTINPNQPNWVMRWVPGALSFNAANSEGYLVQEATTLSTTTLSDLSYNNVAPGYTYLNNTAQTFRCLAACAQVRYTDTELNRKGIVGSNICTGARTWTTIGQAFSVSVDRARVPDQALEVLWQPGEGDEFFTARSTTVYDDETRGRKNGILLSGSGCTTSSISIRLVVVYQWTPQSDDNIILPVPVPGTGHTLAKVMLMARQAGFVAGHLIKGYATGGLYGVAREAASMIKPSLRSMA